LAHYPHELLTSDISVRRAVDAVFGARGRAISSVCEVTYMMAAIGMARAGLGIAILPIGAHLAPQAHALCGRHLIPRPTVRPLAGLGNMNALGS
jgi:DNA-binding transcriptional LysR family regulator